MLHALLGAWSSRSCLSGTCKFNYCMLRSNHGKALPLLSREAQLWAGNVSQFSNHVCPDHCTQAIAAAFEKKNVEIPALKFLSSCDVDCATTLGSLHAIGLRRNHLHHFQDILDRFRAARTTQTSCAIYCCKCFGVIFVLFWGLGLRHQLKSSGYL